jgi:hypothetical protein
LGRFGKPATNVHVATQAVCPTRNLADSGNQAVGFSVRRSDSYAQVQASPGP